MVCLGNEQRSFCCFRNCIQVLHSDSFVDHDGYSISSKGFLHTVIDIMVIWVKFTHSSHLSLLIPNKSIFTLAISCLTTSNLPWFMDLTFQLCNIALYSIRPCFYHQKCKPKPQWGTISCWSVWLPSKSLQTINAGEGVEKKEPSYTVAGKLVQPLWRAVWRFL